MFCTCKHLQVILLTFKNFPSGGQQQGYCSKQAIDNFIHVDSAVVALTPSRGVNWQLFFLDCNLNPTSTFRSIQSKVASPCPPSLGVLSGVWERHCRRHGCSLPACSTLGGGMCEWVLIPELRVDWVVRQLRESGGCVRAVWPVEGACETRLWVRGQAEVSPPPPPPSWTWL